MASHQAFIQNPKDVYVTVEQRLGDSHEFVTEKRDGVQYVMSCHELDCHDCYRRRNETIQLGEGFRFVQQRRCGTDIHTEAFGPGNTLVTYHEGFPNSNDSIFQIVDEVLKNDLCKDCKEVNFSSLLSRADCMEEHPLNVPAVAHSVAHRACPLCSLILSCLIDPDTFVPDDARRVFFRTKVKGESVEVLFPCRELGYEDLVCQRSGVLQIYVDPSKNDKAFVNMARGRLPTHGNRAAAFGSQRLSECMALHRECNTVEKTSSCFKKPTRLINVGPSDGLQDPFIETGDDLKGAYATLSYCWGAPSTITKTTSHNLNDFQKRIPFDSLSPIFRDAITVTRDIGLSYLWIDSLCILQDSLADKHEEIPQMADIYASSILTISASTATSGTSSLFARPEKFNLVGVPVFFTEHSLSGSIYLTNQILAEFSDDVPSGHLATRGWCLQERLLAQRILHFGRDQAHWECHDGIWSESNTKRRWYDEFRVIDDGQLRPALASNLVFKKDSGSLNLGPTRFENDTEELDKAWNKRIAEVASGLANTSLDSAPLESDKRKIYDDWYRAVSAYSQRQLTNPVDKLPALAGAARRFNEFINDEYVAGLWANDLTHGLLWSRRAFAKVSIDASVARRPGIGGWGELPDGTDKDPRGAPSWSWASVDGPVHWIRNRGKTFITQYATATDPTKSYGALNFCALRVRGNIMELGEMSWLRPEASDPENWTDEEKEISDNFVPSLRPEMDPDDPEFERRLAMQEMTRPLYFLAMCDLGGDEGSVEKGAWTMGYALMLRFWPRDGAFRRVGIARVLLKDFLKGDGENDLWIK